MLQIRLLPITSIINDMKTAKKREYYTKSMEEVLDDAVFWARRFAAVDTGEMESKIYSEKDTIVSDAAHSIFNEFGCYNIEVGSVANPLQSTSRSGKIAFRPFIRPAVLLAIQDFPNKLFSKMSATSRGIVMIRVASE